MPIDPVLASGLALGSIPGWYVGKYTAENLELKPVSDLVGERAKNTAVGGVSGMIFGAIIGGAAFYFVVTTGGIVIPLIGKVAPLTAGLLTGGTGGGIAGSKAGYDVEVDQ